MLLLDFSYLILRHLMQYNLIQPKFWLALTRKRSARISSPFSTTLFSPTSEKTALPVLGKLEKAPGKMSRRPTALTVKFWTSRKSDSFLIGDNLASDCSTDASLVAPSTRQKVSSNLGVGIELINLFTTLTAVDIDVEFSLSTKISCAASRTARIISAFPHK